MRKGAMRRRDFLKLVATSTTGAVLFTGCGIGDGDPEREFKIESPVLNPVDLVYGRDNWYATAAGECGLIVRVFEGRAKKVEGNPDFPTNLGASDARAQALVQEVYHPDRIAQPLRLTGARGSGEYQNASWDDALTELGNDVNGARGATLVITPPLSGPMGQVVNEFVRAADAQHVAYEPEDRVVLREAVRRVFGTDTLPTLDLANTNFLVSFSADFLHTWISPVQFSRQYGEFRQGREDVRGTYWHVSSRMDGSAANADRWLPITPGTEGLVALAMAQVMVSEGLVDRAVAERVYSGISLDQYAPDAVAETAGISAEQITELARRFAEGKPSVAIAGSLAAAHTNGLFNLTAVFALNYLVGSVGQAGGIILNPAPPFGSDVPGPSSGLSYTEWTGVVNDLNSGRYQLVIVNGVDPVYGLPEALGLREALANAGKVVALSSFLDDTTLQADLILPVHTTLESWGLIAPDPGPGYQAVALQQPVVNPFVDSRAAGDIFIEAATAAGASMPWPTYEDAVRAAVDSLRRLNRGNIEAADAKQYFMMAQAQGGWWDTTETADSAPNAPETATAAAQPEYAGDPGQFPLYLLPFPSNSLGYGETANLPWLQALPDPMTSAVWSTWVELNPTTADRLGVGTGDVVRLVTPRGSAEVPVYVNPAAHPDVAAVPMGQGHTDFGRYAKGRGTNPLDLVEPATESETGALAWAGTRVRVEATGRKVRLPRFEGQVPAFQLEGAPIIEVIPSEH
ncbi:MAG: molybdopterin-dependent oxidoreductase [Sphaerobacter sp.]|nr:molybdopterin-dependent oxidoreductase [Sphaerobacter sp.]